MHRKRVLRGILARLAGRDLDGRPGRPELRREDVHPELQLALHRKRALLDVHMKLVERQLLVEASSTRTCSMPSWSGL